MSATEHLSRASHDLIAAYYAAFNAGNPAGMSALVSDDVAHYPNQGQLRQGRALFDEFGSHMGVSYRERLEDIVIMVSPDGTRAAAEFTVHGEYLQTDPGLPEAKGQRYILPAGTYFTISANRITRITTYYNLQDWIAQVSAPMPA